MKYQGKKFIQKRFDDLEILAPHKRQRICWIGLEGKNYEQICSSSSPYNNQPSNKSIDEHIKYDLENHYIKEVKD
tara:strand:+ start:199 stop:423 length:225 start_codon:yes stop_codon:yes gene_type:complete